MGIDPEQLRRWKQLVSDRPSDPVRPHWTALHAAARSLLVLVEQQAEEIARLEAELAVTVRAATPVVPEARRGGFARAIRVPRVLAPAAAIVDLAATILAAGGAPGTWRRSRHASALSAALGAAAVGAALYAAWRTATPRGLTPLSRPENASARPRAGVP